MENQHCKGFPSYVNQGDSSQRWKSLELGGIWPPLAQSRATKQHNSPTALSLGKEGRGVGVSGPGKHGMRDSVCQLEFIQEAQSGLTALIPLSLGLGRRTGLRSKPCWEPAVRSSQIICKASDPPWDLWEEEERRKKKTQNACIQKPHLFLVVRFCNASDVQEQLIILQTLQTQR